MNGRMILQATNVGHVYRRDGERLHILEDVNLKLAAGEIVAILGPNGSGKSTLLKLFAGLESPEAGTIQPGHGVSRKGFVFQQDDQNLLPWLRVRDNVMLPLRMVHGPGRTTSEAVNGALRRFGIADLSSRFPSTLSGGQRQLVSLARWYAAPPHILFLDEATAMLDVKQRRNADEVIVELATEHGVAVLFVTHSVQEVASVAQRAVLLIGSPQAPSCTEVSLSPELSTDGRAALIEQALTV